MKIEEMIAGLQERLDARMPYLYLVSEVTSETGRPPLQIRVQDSTKPNFFYLFCIDKAYWEDNEFVKDCLDRIADNLVMERLKGSHR